MKVAEGPSSERASISSISSRPPGGPLRGAAQRAAAMDHLATLYDGQAERLFRLARRLGHDGEAARDLVQEVFVRAASALAQQSAPQPQAAAWLVRVLINAAHDRHRRERVRRAEALDDEIPGGGDAVAGVVARATVERALAQLPLRRRAIVVLAELEGASVAEIAADLGISQVTVRWHLAVGRRELRQWLEKAPNAGQRRKEELR